MEGLFQGVSIFVINIAKDKCVQMSIFTQKQLPRTVYIYSCKGICLMNELEFNQCNDF